MTNETNDVILSGHNNLEGEKTNTTNEMKDLTPNDIEAICELSGIKYTDGMYCKHNSSINFDEGSGYYDDGQYDPDSYMIPKCRDGIIHTPRFEINK